MAFGGLAATVLGFVRAHPEWPALIVFAFCESLPFASLVLHFWAVLVGTRTSLALQTRCRRGRGGARPLETGYRIGLAAQKPSTTAREGLLRAVGIWAIVLARFSGPLRAAVPLVAGIAETPPLRFQIANWTSAFLWAFCLLSPGSWGVRWLLLEYLW
jgi:hypothetical protein